MCYCSEDGIEALGVFHQRLAENHGVEGCGDTTDADVAVDQAVCESMDLNHTRIIQ